MTARRLPSSRNSKFCQHCAGVSSQGPMGEGVPHKMGGSRINFFVSPIHPFIHSPIHQIPSMINTSNEPGWGSQAELSCGDSCPSQNPSRHTHPLHALVLCIPSYSLWYSDGKAPRVFSDNNQLWHVCHRFTTTALVEVLSGLLRKEMDERTHL